LSDPDYKNRDIIFCGHSLGGAVATIVTMFALAEEKRLQETFLEDEEFEKSERKIKCITFGAPAVGDEKLQKVNKMSVCRSVGLSVGLSVCWSVCIFFLCKIRGSVQKCN
jgi:hypothetical protein